MGLKNERIYTCNENNENKSGRRKLAMKISKNNKWNENNKLKEECSVQACMVFII